jgi:methyltransferase (TIGR00027 family)
VSSDGVAATARWVAAARARESERPDALFVDAWARLLAGDEGFALLDRMEAAGAATPYLPLRTRLLDDFLLGAAQPGTEVVIVAAGMDARAYRLPWPDGVRLYELDRAPVLDEKSRLLAGAGAQPRCARVAIAADVTRPLGPLLRAAGFTPGRPSLWLIEGLLVYLTEAEVDALLAEISALAAPGSRIAGDVAGPGLLAWPGSQRVLATLEAAGAPWRFATDDPVGLFARHGWEAVAREPSDPTVARGRWPFPPIPPQLPGVPRSWFVTATRR